MTTDQTALNRFIADIRVPTLLVHAEDDPFLPAASIPVKAAQDNPEVTLELHRRGGHVGFLQGTPRRPSFWGEARVADFLAERLTAPSQTPA